LVRAVCAPPIVRTHPETGRRGLYVNAAFTSHIEGMEQDASDRLLELLYRQASVPEYQCRNPDYSPSRRVMERVTIVGDTPY
jgi:taurine dioxygenase